MTRVDRLYPQQVHHWLQAELAVLPGPTQPMLERCLDRTQARIGRLGRIRSAGATASGSRDERCVCESADFFQLVMVDLRARYPNVLVANCKVVLTHRTILVHARL